MKKITLSALALTVSAGSAFAADLPSRKAAPVYAPPPPMWTGFYAGLNAGGIFGNNSAPNTTTWNVYRNAGNADYASAALLSGSAFSNGNGGFIGGGQIGYNWQIPFGGAGFVSGIEADIQGIAGSGSTGSRWSAANTSDVLSVPPADPITLLSNQQGKANLQYIGTVRGRLGYLVMPTLLVYGTGGLAYGGVSINMTNFQSWTATNSSGNDAVIAGSGAYANTQVGWTAGGGLEWMFMQNWSAKVEYLYYDLGRVSGSFVNTWSGLGSNAGVSDVESVTNFSARTSGNIVRAGVNYHFNFGAAPVVAKYC
jgi:outer membrane immunogenic protein